MSFLSSIVSVSSMKCWRSRLSFLGEDLLPFFPVPGSCCGVAVWLVSSFLRGRSSPVFLLLVESAPLPLRGIDRQTNSPSVKTCHRLPLSNTLRLPGCLGIRLRRGKSLYGSSVNHLGISCLLTFSSNFLFEIDGDRILFSFASHPSNRFRRSVYLTFLRSFFFDLFQTPLVCRGKLFVFPFLLF